ncbi:MAG: hypothetical protein IT438_12645 [Phycisphaerales bacterium]|nr:hypothetical protein [Phycisphaerales bacterium]
MGNIPSDRNELFTFAQAHAQVFIDNAPTIGLTVAMANAVKTATLATGTAISDADVARSAARTATQDLSESYTDLRRVVSEAVRTINNFALNAADPALVYSKAQIAPPADRTNLPPPNAPFDLGVSLNPSTGSLLVRWKASQPQGMTGVVYNVQRRVGNGGGAGGFTQVALTGQKRFEDSTIPAGTSVLAYTIQSQRGSQTSPLSNIIEVRFGVGGGMMVKQYAASEDPAFKMAA